jgi:hypothetical protein
VIVDANLLRTTARCPDTALPEIGGSFLWVDPRARIACTSLTGRNLGDRARQAWQRLPDDMLVSHAKDD